MNKKTIITGALGISLLFSPSVVKAATFTDVSSNNLYSKEINELAKKKIVSTSNKKFNAKGKLTESAAVKIANSAAKNVKIKPKLTKKSVSKTKTLTRVQAVKMLVDKFKINTKTTGKPFTDVSTKSSYYKTINKAYNAGILTKGYSSKLNPNQKITREEFAGLTVKAMNYQKLKGKSYESTVFKRIDRSIPPKGHKYPKSYKMMTDGLKKTSTTIKYDVKELPFRTASDVMYKDFYLNTPSRYLVEGWTTSSNGTIKIMYTDKASVAAKKLKDSDKKAEAAIKQIIKPNYTDYDKVKAVHDYVAKNTVYDHKGWATNKASNDSYTIAGPLLKGVAVCDGYARTTSYLLDKLGIDNKYVLGTSDGELHSWNKVKVDGKWYNVDVTWDDPSTSKNGKYNYKYFLIDDKTMSKTHKEKKMDYPKATSKKYLNK